MESYDVIIVGAGPAGLKCAETLGNSNYKVLLLEKNSEIGPKVCAGGISRKTIDFLNLPDELIDFRFGCLNFYVNNICTQIRNEGNFVFTIDRKKLGQWQLKRLKKFRNIAIKTSSLVKKITENSIFINDKKIKYKILVGADGSNSIIRKYLGIDSKNIGTAMQYIIKNKKHKNFEVFFNPKLFSAGYAWIFPHNKYTSVGCGLIPNISKENLRKNFNLWLKRRNINISNAKYEASTYNHEYKGHKFDNIYLAGDAGGFLSSFTGEGIYQALVSGEEIAKMILDGKYKSSKIKEILKMKNKHDKILYLLNISRKISPILLRAGSLLIKIPYFRRKAIELLA